MDAQLKKGFLEFCVLAALKDADSYGYQIVKDVSTCIEISESTLYPILKRLETSQQVSTYSVEHNSRLRKYYQITDKGIGQINRFLEDWDEIEKIYKFIKGDKEDE
ncbi:PadR family transcriptional regulator [Anaerorhabdus furcosa]|uniref:PadR family transcriptional regulator, regulatory protein PadR n=1 Tax=Anaerorhabdus furcosa TaxID=118967 RepID=A0A1T4K615_9FIRM|nr:PadR family transcriptional regulator [Anaerorhabdus furcosa]SJZ37869.1 PadR family transcriptional regulator, regulatory protein PadR [Anaerorhabdus furcosa]